MASHLARGFRGHSPVGKELPQCLYLEGLLQERSYIQGVRVIVADVVSALPVALALSIPVSPSCSYCQHPPTHPLASWSQSEPGQLEVP